MSNKLRPALEQLDKLSKAQPENILIYIRMANVAYMMEDYDAMTLACVEALKVDENNAEANYLHARACIGKENPISAIAYLTKAIAADEKYGSAYLLRAETLLKMGDSDSADKDAEWLVQNAEINEDILLLKARIEEARGKHDDALEYYNKVIEQNPFCIDAFKERGAIKLATGDKDGAEEDMRQVLELNPKAQNGVNGEYTAEGTENIQQKVEQAYRSVDPYGIGGINV
jgi:tetratricopeptide (TPR) repeat protein